MSAPSLATTLNLVSTNENNFIQVIANKSGISVPSNPTLQELLNIEQQLKIGELQGKAGGGGQELFFALNGSNGGSTIQSADLSWGNGTTYNWTLDWNTTSNTATFTVTNGGVTLLHDILDTYQYDKFNALSLITRADAGFGATMNLAITEATYTDNTTQSLNYFVESKSTGTIWDKKFFLLDNYATQEITQLKGSFNMSWTVGSALPNNGTKDANSEVGFYVRLYDPPVQSVPEPATILGLFGVGLFGTTLLKRPKSDS